MSRCPHCGREINDPRKRTFESSVRSHFKNDTMALPAPLPPVTRQSTVSLPSMESHVHVPVNQALITGCLFAPVVFLSVSSVARIWLTTGEALLAGGVTGGIALFLVAALKWQAKTAFYDSLLQTVETELGVDLDGDGQVGPPEIVKVEVKSEDGNRWQFADLPGKPEALREFAKRVLMGQGFTDETGTMAGLTQKEVKDLREVFVSRGWARWKHATRKQQGVDVTRVGAEVLRAIAGDRREEVSPEIQP